MPRSYSKGKVRVWKAHTRKDQRYTRANRVAMTKCPICTATSLKEVKCGGFVWASCTSCGESGESEQIRDNHLMDVCDVVSTITDAYYATNY